VHMGGGSELSRTRPRPTGRDPQEAEACETLHFVDNKNGDPAQRPSLMASSTTLTS
jgi:hypothetical protein